MKKLFFFLCLMATFVFTVPASATSSGPPIPSTEISFSIDASVSAIQSAPLIFEKAQEVPFMGAGDYLLSPAEKPLEIMVPQKVFTYNPLLCVPDITWLSRDDSKLQLSPPLKICYISPNHYSRLGNSMWN